MPNKILGFITRRWLYKLIPGLVYILGLLLTWITVSNIRQQETSKILSEFRIRANELAAGLERRLTYNGEILQGVAGLLASSDHVSRDEFQRYIRQLKLSVYYPGIQSIGYSTLIPETEKQQHITKIRAEGFTDYDIRPAGEREFYSSVIFVEPLNSRNQQIMGYDMLSEPVKMNAAGQARDLAAAVMTGKITLQQETEQPPQSGIFIFSPIYQNNMPVYTIEQRRNALTGWVYAEIRLQELLTHYLQQGYPDFSRKIALRLYSGKHPGSPELMIDTYPPDLSHSDEDEMIRSSEILGSGWTLHIKPLPTYWTSAGSEKSSNIAIQAGIILSLLSAFLSYVLANSHLQVRTALTERRKNEAAMQLASTVLDASPGGIMVTDADKRIIAVNPAFTRITGYALEDILHQNPRILSSGQQDEMFYQTMWQSIEQHGYWEGELINRRKDGQLLPELLSISQVFDKEGNVMNYVGMFLDISARREAEARIQYLAHHDYLTNLPNRLLLVEHATQALTLARRYKRRMAIFYIDLDRFKPINDQYGHNVGDVILKTVAQRLLSIVRESDTVCRQGGDEFVILLPEFMDTDSLEILAIKLRDEIQKPSMANGYQLTISASIGIATYPDNGDTVDAIIQSADTAMYSAKADKEKHICFAPSIPTAKED